MYRFGHCPGSDTRPEGRHLMCLQQARHIRWRQTHQQRRQADRSWQYLIATAHDIVQPRLSSVSVTSSVVGQSAWLAVRDELIRQGVPKSAVRILISAATGTGIEARSVAVSVFRQQSTSPAV